MDDCKTYRRVEEIPLPYRSVFNEYPCFNAIQSKVLDDILYTDHSVVISSPTGSGKTVLFELAIVRLLMQCENVEISQDIKIVYISPIKSLCQERLFDWHEKFSSFGLNCASFTGDSDNVDFQQLTNHNLIISTPEKWDSLTRKWRENEEIVKVVKLFLIDEVHLLNEENRGSILEVIVSRMKTVEQSVVLKYDGDVYNQKIRFIALSATVPNTQDIAEWLGKPPHTKFYKFSEEMRPVKLQKIVLGYPPKATPFKFDMSLNYKLQSLIIQYSEGKPTLIFCNTRKSVEMAANHIMQTLRIQLSNDQLQKLMAVAELITDPKVKAPLKYGIGYHHAGMMADTRHAIENAFRNGDLPVLVTTSTLAMGVNLPAHLVIIKSTKCYDTGGFRDYKETAIHQMVGRAGRPQFDTSATALILTTVEDKPKFERMIDCIQPIESNLHRHLIEHLNAEVVLKTITDLDVAMQWLASTFLYVRARKNPKPYGLNTGLNKDQIDRKLLEICQIDLNKLVKAGMLTIDEDINITPTVTGQIMAKFYVAFETMKLFTGVSGTEVMIQILDLVSRCQEFSEVRLRVNEKKTLNLLNKNPKSSIRFPLKGKIKTWSMKVNCIIQAVLGNLDISDHSILSETFTIMRNGERVTKCLIEYLETRKNNCYSALLNAVILCKCFQAKLWEDTPYVSKQLSGIGSVMSHQLANAGKTTFQKILQSNPRDIEMVIRRKSPMGNTLMEEVQHIPSYEMQLEKINNDEQLKISLRVVNVEDLRVKSTINTSSTMTLIVGNDLNEVLVYEKYRVSYLIEYPRVQKIVDIDKKCTEVNAHFISNDWVGIDCNSTVKYEAGRKGKTYIQTFLDIYAKSKKKIAKDSDKENKTPKKKENKEVKASSEDKNVGKKRKDRTEKEKVAKQFKKVDQMLNISGVTKETTKDGDLEASSKDKVEDLNLKLPSIPLNSIVEVDEVAHNEDFKQKKIEDVLDTSATSLFSNGLSTAQFAEYASQLDEDILKELQESFKENDLVTSNAEDPPENKENSMEVDEKLEDIEDMDRSRRYRAEKSPENKEDSMEADEKLEDIEDIYRSRGYIAEKSAENKEDSMEADEKLEDIEDIDRSRRCRAEKSAENKEEFMEAEGKVEDIEDKAVLDFDSKLLKNSSTFQISKKYIVDGKAVGNSGKKLQESNNMKRKTDSQLVMRFDGLKDDLKKRHKMAEFKFPNKRKFAHHHPDPEDLPDSTQDQKMYKITEMLEPNKGRSSACQRNVSEKSLNDIGIKFKDEGNAGKSISWRSPLVFSPAVKFSPKLNFPFGSHKESAEVEAQHESINETFETSVSSKSTNNPVHLQRTPRPVKRFGDNVGPNRGTRFPLCDREYGEEQISDEESGKEDPFDICSTSFLEQIGLSKGNQNKPINRHKFKDSSPAANYYSQLISHPVHSQKDNPRHKTPNRAKAAESLENFNTKCPKIAADKETEPTISECSESEELENAKQGASSMQFVASENRPLVQDKSLDYSVTKNDSRSSENVGVYRNLPAPQSEYFQHGYNLQNPHRFYQNSVPYRNNIPQYQNLNETITSNGYPNDFNNSYTQQCQRKTYRNPYFYPNQMYANSIPTITPRGMQMSALNTSFCHNFNQDNDFPPSDYLENYATPFRDPNFHPQIAPQHNFHPAVAYQDYRLQNNQNFVRGHYDSVPDHMNASFFVPDAEIQNDARNQENRQRSFATPKDDHVRYEPNGNFMKRQKKVNAAFENTGLKEERIKLMDSQNYSERIHNSNVPNSSFIATRSAYPPEWNYPGFTYQMPRFRNGDPVEPRFVYDQGYCVPPTRDMTMFPPCNDKEYVMNKFLHSLSQD